MKKFPLHLLAILLIALSVAAITVNAAEEQSACPYCGRESEDWIALTTNGQDISDGHYYLADDGHVSAAHTIKSGKTVCLDLRGYLNNANRMFTVENGGKLYIWGGSIEARGYGSRELGGLVNLEQGGTLVMNDVDVYYKVYDKRDTKKGGILAVAGNATLTDCTITGGRATEQGGNVYVSPTGVLTLNDTSVTGGMIVEDTTHTSRCVYSEGKVVLSGDSTMELTNMGTGASLEISGAYTGAARLYFDSVPASGTVIGTVGDGGDITAADITVVNGELEVRVTGNTLTVNEPPVAVVNGVRYDDLEEAIEAAGEYPLVLGRSLGKVTLTKALTVDLAGHNIEELCADGVTVSVMDSKTDDYDIGDGVYGKIQTYTGVVEGKVLDDTEQYLVWEDEKEGTSFHKLRMVMTQAVIRPSVAGLYYRSEFKGDTIVQSQVKTFGVELGLTRAELMDETMEPGHYTAIGNAKFNEDAAATSTVLTNVMRTDRSDITNRRHAATKVYGRPYIRFADNHIMQGTIKEISLQESVKKISDKDTLQGLEWEQQDALIKMYYRYQSVVKYWGVPALESFSQEWEDDIRKILIIGNSHSQDSAWQLENVFAHQEPGQRVVVGVLYHSGCSVAQHVNYSKNNLAEYQYYKNIYGEWFGEDTPQDTMLQALQDEKWDVILLQEMNVALGKDYTDNNNNLQTLINYVKTNTEGEPVLGFNMVWANPVIDAYLKEDTRMTHSMEDGKDLNDWIASYEKNFGTDQQHMFRCMLNNVKQYIVNNEAFTQQYIMPAGTAVQYANNVLGLTDTDLYRDYTHLSEMSRLMISYLWYCKITGERITSVEDINVDVIPKELRHSRFRAEGDLKITGEMKEVILAAVNYALEHPFEGVEEPAKPVDPKADGTLDVLMIGNSFCHYFPDELKAMADVAGKELRVCNVYYSGCSLKQHYRFLKNGEEVYDFRENGDLIEENVSLWHCLKQGNWDVISFQEGSSGVRGVTADVEEIYKENVRYFGYLYDSVRERFPLTTIAFHQTWAYQVGTTSTGFTTADSAAQQAHHERIVAYTQKFIDRFEDMELVNSGDAWAIIRTNGYDNLCARLGKKVGTAAADSGDNYHDGDIGGGQFLNACVWYQYLFEDLDVRENTFVPTYDRPGTTGAGTLNTSGTGGHYELNGEITAQELRAAAYQAVNDPSVK